MLTGGRIRRQPITLYPVRKQREMNAGAPLTLSFVFSSKTPAHGQWHSQLGSAFSPQLTTLLLTRPERVSMGTLDPLK